MLIERFFHIYILRPDIEMREVLCSAVCNFSVYILIDYDQIYRTVEFRILSVTSFPQIFRVSSFKGFHVCI